MDSGGDVSGRDAGFGSTGMRPCVRAGLRLLRRGIARYVTLTNRSYHQELKFRIHVRRQSVPRIQTLLGVFVGLVVLGWPTDFLLFERPAVVLTFSLWRLLTVAGLVGLSGLVSWLDPVREGSFWICMAYLSLYFAASGYLFGNVRGLSFPWFYLTYMLPAFLMVVAIDLFPRLVATVMVTASYVVGYMVVVPAPLHFPDLFQFGLLTATSIFLFTLTGHSIYHLDRVNFFQSRNVKQHRAWIKELARRDPLTGLLNRGALMKRFEAELHRARRYDHVLSALMVDLDRFKRVNDNHGHQTGDRVLKVVGRILRETTRENDVTGRYGGEEFLVVLPETGADDARRVAERIKGTMSRRTFEGDGTSFTVTCSIGVAGFEGQDGDTGWLLERMDDALYEAKQRGRNRVVIAG